MRKIKRKNKNKIKIISLLIICVFFLSIGYSTFNTNLSINTKGNIKISKEAIDNKIPKDNLLSWFEADNPNNTNAIFKNKISGGTDGIMHNFDNTSTSGFNNDELIFDGINDYVDIGYANYDFNDNGLSVVIYVKRLSENFGDFFGDWDGSGFGFGYEKGSDSSLYFCAYDENATNYKYTTFNNFNTQIYYTLIATYSNKSVILYVNGKQESIIELSKLRVSQLPIFIGANPEHNERFGSPSNISIKEAMLYNRALTQDEVTTITNGFKKKYE